jgi:peptide subunit release factor 1 (eRF1)
VRLPDHLCALAGADREVELDIAGKATQKSVLDALEKRYPALKGALRDPVTAQRRPFVRFFACGKDLSHQSSELALPIAVASGNEPFLIIAAIAGG